MPALEQFEISSDKMHQLLAALTTLNRLDGPSEITPEWMQQAGHRRPPPSHEQAHSLNSLHVTSAIEFSICRRFQSSGRGDKADLEGEQRDAEHHEESIGESTGSVHKKPKPLTARSSRDFAIEAKEIPLDQPAPIPISARPQVRHLDEVGKKAPAARKFATYQEMLASDAIDAILIATRPQNRPVIGTEEGSGTVLPRHSMTRVRMSFSFEVTIEG